MKHIKKRKIFIPIVMASLISTFGVGTFGFVESARAATSASSISTENSANINSTGNKNGFGKGRGQGASGVVTAVNGNILTITGKNNVVYAVDASKATILRTSTLTSKNGTTAPGVPSAIGLSDLKIGDTITIRGTITGTTIAATKIVDGKSTLPKSKAITHSNKNPKNTKNVTLKK